MRRRLKQAYRNFKYIRLNRPRVKVRPTDGFVTSWPRSGNTWMRYLLFGALYPDVSWDLVSLNKQMPSIADPDLNQLLAELDNHAFRMFKSHENAQEYILGGRVVYLVRDGRDATCSFYHYRTKLNKRDYTFRQYLERSLAGKFRYGSWHEHVCNWLSYESHPSLLVVRYEDMLVDAATQLKRVLNHFGTEVAEDCITAAVERSSVGRVNQGFAQYAAGKDRQFSGGQGGGTGKFRQWFTEQDELLFMEYAGETMQKLGYT